MVLLNKAAHPAVLLVSVVAVAASAVVLAKKVTKSLEKARKDEQRRERAKWVDKEKEKDEQEQETLPSILDHFRDLQLDDTVTVDEANKRRTTRYYELARDAHIYDLVVGVRSYPRLRNGRSSEMARIMKYKNLNKKGDTKSHRTVLVMCDAYTTTLLCKARHDILEPLKYSTEITTEGVWIPKVSIIPPQDMHVTVAIPFWWHTVRPGNLKLSQELVARFRQALVLEFHHPFQVELERIVLLGGKTLVALWRCVGERTTADGEVIYDRHGEGKDPFVKLRRDIVRCFTSTESFEAIGKAPLTYSHRFQENGRQEASMLPESSPPPMPIRGQQAIARENTIEAKTPGLGNRDGFIHTTLARLPIDCLSMTDVELAPIHRLCREATATYCGHRLVVSKFRFIETTGAGGESNPCVEPIFDETVDAPPRFEVGATGGVNETNAFSKTVEQAVTIGAPPTTTDRTHVDSLFPDAADIQRSTSGD